MFSGRINHLDLQEVEKRPRNNITREDLFSRYLRVSRPSPPTVGLMFQSHYERVHMLHLIHMFDCGKLPVSVPLRGLDLRILGLIGADPEGCWRLQFLLIQHDFSIDLSSGRIHDRLRLKSKAPLRQRLRTTFSPIGEWCRNIIMMFGGNGLKWSDRGNLFGGKRQNKDRDGRCEERMGGVDDTGRNRRVTVTMWKASFE
jgi:hypothetical protein